MKPRLRASAAALGIAFVALAMLNLLGETVFFLYLKHFSRNKILRTQLADPRKIGLESHYIPHPYYVYRPRPSFRSADGLLSHNSFGCRAAEVTVPKPAGVYRIVIVGGSTTYEMTVPENRKTFSYLLEKSLNEQPRKDGKRVEVVNCGAPGYTSAEILSRYVYSLRDYQPDLLIAQMGINDTGPRKLPRMSRDYGEFTKVWEEEDSRPGISFIHRLARAVLRRASGSVMTQEILQVVRKLDGTDDLNMERNSPWVFEANTRDLVRIAKADGAEVVLQTEHISVPGPSGGPRPDWRTLPWGTLRGTLEHNELLKKLAGQEHARCFDLQGELCACRELMPDGKHLNEEGNARKAQALLKFLRHSL